MSFDEATSSVDTRTEARIQKALLRLMEGRTSFVIAHRLRTIRDADIKDGEIVERATHDQLLKERDFYHYMYMSQFKGEAISSRWRAAATERTEIVEKIKRLFSVFSVSLWQVLSRSPRSLCLRGESAIQWFQPCSRLP